MAIFDHTHPKIIESTFNFPELVLACKKSLFYFFIFEIQSKDTFDHVQPKSFQLSFDFVSYTF